MKPNKKNFCGGSFSDWLAVHLLQKCNAKCNFCIERKEGYVFKKNISWKDMAKKIVEANQPKIMLLGGEPTLYPHLGDLINYIKENSTSEIYLTTNSFLLTKLFVSKNLKKLSGISLSICHYDPKKNKEIYGLTFCMETLKKSIAELKSNGCLTRINCNLIKGYIDNKKEILKMIAFCKEIGATEIRISEVFSDSNEHIKLEEIFSNKYGLNDEPFSKGCLHTTKISGFKVVFRQCCGLETKGREEPKEPEILICNKILYYNGKIFSGWIKKNIERMNPEIIKEIIKENIIDVLSKKRGLYVNKKIRKLHKFGGDKSN